MNLLIALMIPFLGLVIKKINLIAFLLIWIFGFSILNYIGIIAYLALIIMLFFAFLSDYLKESKKNKVRNYKDILSNTIVSILSLVLYIFLKDTKFIILYYISLSGILSDILASAFGVLSKSDPIYLMSFKRVEKGTSGAVSVLGLYLSLVGGVLISLIYSLAAFNLKYFIFITLAGLFGSVIDSVLGGLFQVRYKCLICDKQTEMKYHCNKKTIKIKGYYFINNNTVNFLSNVIVFIIFYLLI